MFSNYFARYSNDAFFFQRQNTEMRLCAKYDFGSRKLNYRQFFKENVCNTSD